MNSLDSSSCRAALLFQIGPVQDFIQQARKTQDLWAGSYLLSFLISKAHAVIASALDPEAIVYPQVRDQPLFRWHRSGEVPPEKDRLFVPNVPNRFLVLGPDAGVLRTLANRAEAAVRSLWRDEIAKAVWQTIQDTLGHKFQGWDAFWSGQVDRFPVIDTLVHEWKISSTGPALHREIAAADWKFAALRSARRFTAWHKDGPASKYAVPKDHLDGRNEVLGGHEWREFWKALREHPKFTNKFKGEQLYGAVTVIKRLYPDFYLGPKFHWGNWKPVFLSVPEIAATNPAGAEAQSVLAAGDPDIPDTAKEAENGRYYAILAMDGDDMGKWISGTHPQAKAADPNYLADISRKLSDFGLDSAGSIVKAHGGQMIYCGGDDVLAMVPAPSALSCGNALQAAFAAALPGATASVGIAIGHKQSPMQDTLRAAFAGESTAKQLEGKAAFSLRILKRSGESTEVCSKWNAGAIRVWEELGSGEHHLTSRFCHRFGELAAALLGRASASPDDRWEPQWTPDLRDAVEAELAHCLRQQSTAEATAKHAVLIAAKWMTALSALPPRDFLHFWMARAFLNRLATSTSSQP